MTVTLLECGVCGKPARDRCEHLAAILNAPAVTHWDSPDGQTQSCPNCDRIAFEYEAQRERLCGDNIMLSQENATLADENAKLRRELEYAKALAAESKELADSEWHLLESENAKLRAVVEAAMNFRQSIGPREWPEADCGLSRALDVLPPSDVEGTP